MSREWKAISRSKRHSHHGIDLALDLLLELSRRRFGMDLNEIQAHTGVGYRQCFRVLHSLEAAGVKFEFKKQPGRKGWERVVRLVNIRGSKLVSQTASVGS